MNKKIAFHFQPVLKNGSMTIVKEKNGKQKKYIEGVSSGLKKDAHKERMSEDCIKSFFDQANTGDVLLFPDVHGIRQSEDIGILEKSDIQENGDWWTQYRLYDESDNIGQVKTEKINNLWAQLQGLPPYTKPKQMGFSIEGIIPDNGISTTAKGEKFLDGIDLDGVVLVPRPAYIDSIANTVYKALDILPDWREDKVKKSINGRLDEILAEKSLKNQYWSKKYDINSALSETIEEIMEDRQSMKSERLHVLFKEYKNTMIGLLMESQELFQKNSLNNEVTKSVEIDKSKSNIYRSLILELETLKKSILRRI